MIARLIVFIFCYVGIGGGVLYVAVRAMNRLLAPHLRRRTNQQLGARNARLLEAHEDETCAICLKPIDPHVDLYHKRRGWMHDKCYRDLLS